MQYDIDYRLCKMALRNGLGPAFDTHVNSEDVAAILRRLGILLRLVLLGTGDEEHCSSKHGTGNVASWQGDLSNDLPLRRYPKNFGPW